MGHDNRMHFIGMIAALVVVFGLGFALGAAHGFHHARFGGYGSMGGHMRGGYGGGYSQIKGGRGEDYFYVNDARMMGGGGQRVIIQEKAATTTDTW